jgi:hypothetical protein
MVRKDWKFKGEGVWENWKHWPYLQLIINFESNAVQIKKIGKQGYWIRHLTKKFKTEKQALKFAKSYMRKN